MLAAVEVASGSYEIGNEDLPSASPRHRRVIDIPYWIDSVPLSWAHYEVFIAAGGYSRDELWSDLESAARGSMRPQSVDCCCRAKLEQAADFRRSLRDKAVRPEDIPLTCVTWFEAVAVCRFYHARLPFEAEWEIAMAVAQNARADHRSVWSQERLPDQWDCKPMLGLLQEWVMDAFSPRYWRADYELRGIPWRPEQSSRDVTVRGAGPDDLHRHICARMGRDPASVSPFRGFRRVWEARPMSSDVTASWQPRGF